MSERESGNYVTTVMGGRYDALIWLEETQALHPLHHELPPREPGLETEPSATEVGCSLLRRHCSRGSAGSPRRSPD